MFSSKYGKCHAGSISATPSAEMNRVEMTFAMALAPSGREWCRRLDRHHSRISSVEPGGGEEHVPGQVPHHALHLRLRAGGEVAAAVVGQREVLVRDQLQLLVELLALGIVEAGGRLVQQLVDLRVGVLAVVLAAAGVEYVGRGGVGGVDRAADVARDLEVAAL